MNDETANRLVRILVVVIAVALPLLPVTVWASTALPIYRLMWHGQMLLLYLPARMLGLVGNACVTRCASDATSVT